MIRLLAFLLVASGSAAAETARVYSGEHGTFTRLVIELPSATEWTVGRKDPGYAFAVQTEVQPEYDLTGVWQKISRSRISALQVDPASGALTLSLGCDCHVFPFEYRPGAIVLDVKPGSPPAGSEFEAVFAGAPAATAAVAPSAVLPTESYNWLRERPATTARSSESLPLPLATGKVSLEPLRDSLLEQIARGAADGVVDMGMPMPGPSDTAPVLDELPWSSIVLGENPGILVSDPDSFDAGKTPTGDCPAEELLDIAAWGGENSPLDLLAGARADLYGELDIADPKAMLKAVQSHLYLGFGAEAAQLADLAEGEESVAVMGMYRSMAKTMDGEADPATPFAMMLDCDGPAALWAALARDQLPRGKGVNREAILRSFLALPPHLRAHLGSSLAEKFLDLDDPDAVLTIRNAMERAPNVDAATVALVDAERELHLGNVDAAQAHAEEAVSLEGNGADGLVALVEAHFQKLSPLGPDVAEALLSGRSEAGDTKGAEEMDRAIALALALSGQIDAAFRHAEANDATLLDLWRIVQAFANDDDFLRQAILPDGALPPPLPPKLLLDISRRLQSLGFADAALTWIGTVGPNDPSERRLVAAMVLQDTGDAKTALLLLEGLSGAEAASVRARALVQLGELSAAEEALSAAGQTEDAARTSRWNGDWSALGPTTPGTWKAAADLALPRVAEAGPGLLGRGEQAVEASVSSRAAIEALLEEVGRPEGG